MNIVNGISASPIDGLVPVELLVLGLIDNVHAAAAEFVKNPIVGKGLTDHDNSG
ncbi:MAG: hypothetical protein IH853_10500 [Bacteroidetes bacterium]|nr:hypothetical protein [Bacteroidota bacterium]